MRHYWGTGIAAWAHAGRPIRARYVRPGRPHNRPDPDRPARFCRRAYRAAAARLRWCFVLPPFRCPARSADWSEGDWRRRSLEWRGDPASFPNISGYRSPMVSETNPSSQESPMPVCRASGRVRYSESMNGCRCPPESAHPPRHRGSACWRSHRHAMPALRMPWPDRTGFARLADTGGRNCGHPLGIPAAGGQCCRDPLSGVGNEIRNKFETILSCVASI